MSVAETRDPKFQRRYRKKKKSNFDSKVYNIAQKAIADNEKQVVEKKRVAGTQTSQNIDYNGTIYNLFSVNQGSSITQRVGDQCHIKSILMRFSITHYDTTQLMRVVIYRWTGDQTDATTVTNVLNGATSVGAPLEPFNWQFRRDFHVLYDNCFALSTNTNAVIVEKLYIKKVGMIQFEPGSATVQKNGIYALFISDSSAVAHPYISYRTSITYTDM